MVRGLNEITEKAFKVSQNEISIEIMWPEIRMSLDYAVDMNMFVWRGNGYMQ